MTSSLVNPINYKIMSDKITKSTPEVPATGTTKKQKKASSTLKIKITDHVSGLFMLPYTIGQNIELDAKLAQEIIDAKCAVKA